MRVDRSVWACKERVSQPERVEAVERSPGCLCGDGAVCDGLSSIGVAQWNYDYSLAKIPELEVWLKKYDVDVAIPNCVQNICVTRYQITC